MSRAGEDVTEDLDAWKIDDYELVATNLEHPTIKSGQHTNGPATIWVRNVFDREWICTGEHSMHKVRKRLAKDGIEAFQKGGA